MKSLIMLCLVGFSGYLLLKKEHCTRWPKMSQDSSLSEDLLQAHYLIEQKSTSMSNRDSCEYQSGFLFILPQRLQLPELRQTLFKRISQPSGVVFQGASVEIGGSITLLCV